MTTFHQKLNTIVRKNNSFVCIGLDSNLTKIPKHLLKGKNPQYEFNKAIIDTTFDLVCAYKPNIAFYEAEGAEGIMQLKLTIDYLKEKYPEILVILDAKRADIDSTNEGYVKFAFDYLGADAITLHPYLGKEALKSFLDRKDRGCFVLCRTSNPGAGEFQDLLLSKPGLSSEALTKEEAGEFQDLPVGRSPKDTSDGVRMHSSEVEDLIKPLYQIIAEKVVKEWNTNGNCGLVVGATYPSELKIVRHIVGDGFPLLIPGIGTQGGDVENTVKAAIDKNGLNAIINSSRAIIFASTGMDFAQQARMEAKKLRNEINRYRK